MSGKERVVNTAESVDFPQLSDELIDSLEESKSSRKKDLYKSSTATLLLLFFS